MHWLLGAMQDDTIFIITLVVVLIVVIGYLVLGRDDTIRLQEEEEQPTNRDDPAFQEKVLHRLDRTNDLLTSIRNGLLLLVVLIVLVPVLLMMFSKGCKPSEAGSSAHVQDSPNTYNR